MVVQSGSPILNATTFMQLMKKYPQMLSMQADMSLITHVIPCKQVEQVVLLARWMTCNIISDDIGFILSYVKGVGDCEWGRHSSISRSTQGFILDAMKFQYM